MKNKSLLMSISALALLGVLGAITVSSASAYQGDYTKKGPNYTAERHEAMQKAFASNDYDAWKNLMQGRGRATQVINKDNFAKFAEANKLAQQGKYAEADAIRKELGLRTRDGQRVGAGNGQGMGYGRMAK